MKTLHIKNLKYALIIICVFSRFIVNSQSCTPLGDQNSFGTGNVWIGYVYGGMSFTTYRGYVNEGNAGSADFDQSFGGANVNYATNGCPQNTQNFSVRYKLRKNFSNQNIQFTVGGDDGYRLSIDGGATWLINRWNDQGYNTTVASAYMNGTYDLVLEYYENGGDNRISFSSVVTCTGTDDPTVYGTNNIWRGYIFEGRNFNAYKGLRLEGSTMDPNFDENFGGANVTMSGLTCPIVTENFSARFRLTKNLPAGTYVFTVGGDDGYRFSLDGGATWVINNWTDHSYTVESYTVSLSGVRNMVLEYYEVGGDNRVTFTMSASLLPVKLTSFTANVISSAKTQLVWKTQTESNISRYAVQRSTDGRNFTDAGSVNSKQGSAENVYQFVDQYNGNGTIYYRLAIHDLDGSFTYSTVVTVDKKSVSENKLYPTVVTNGSIFFESDKATGAARFEVFDTNGRLVSAQPVNVIYGRQQLNITNTVKGSYMARISDKNGILISKMIIVQ